MECTNEDEDYPLIITSMRSALLNLLVHCKINWKVRRGNPWMTSYL